MLKLADRIYGNVDYQSSLYTFDQLCEKTYLAGIIDQLRRLLGGVFEEFQFIVYSGGGSADVDLSAGDPAKTVVVYVSDKSASVPYELCAKVRVVFKCYLPRERVVPNLYSLPLGCVASTPAFAPVPLNQRRQNVFFSGNLNGSRVPLLKVLGTPIGLPGMVPRRILSLWKPSMTFNAFIPPSYICFTKGFRSGLSGYEYGQHLVNSKIVLCPRGFRSAETFRHFEAMRAGAIIVSEELPPLDCYAGSPIITVGDWWGLRGLIANLLSRPECLMKLHNEALAWWNDVCSEAAVALRIAERIL